MTLDLKRGKRQTTPVSQITLWETSCGRAALSLSVTLLGKNLPRTVTRNGRQVNNPARLCDVYRVLTKTQSGGWLIVSRHFTRTAAEAALQLHLATLESTTMTKTTTTTKAPKKVTCTCQDCGKSFKTTSAHPSCPHCGGTNLAAYLGRKAERELGTEPEAVLPANVDFVDGKPVVVPHEEPQPEPAAAESPAVVPAAEPVTEVKLTFDSQERITKAIVRTWNAIAADCEAIPGWKNKTDDIVEMTLDAGRLNMYGGDEEAVALFDGLPFDQQMKIGRSVLYVFADDRKRYRDAERRAAAKSRKAATIKVDAPKAAKPVATVSAPAPTPPTTPAKTGNETTFQIYRCADGDKFSYGALQAGRPMPWNAQPGLKVAPPVFRVNAVTRDEARAKAWQLFPDPATCPTDNGIYG